MADQPTPPTPQKDALTTILEQLPEIEQLPEEDRERIVQIVQVAKQSSGPLPAPEDFERYNRELPGAGDRILKMAERALGGQH